MKKRLSIAVILLVSVFLFATVNIVQAQWPAIKESGYAVTTNWHGLDVPIGQSVVATAGTTDLGVTKVEFKWHYYDPSDNVIFDEFVDISASNHRTTPDVPPSPIPPEITDWATDPSNAAIEYLFAQNTQTPNAIGEWGIQAIFYNATHVRSNNTIRIRATSFNSVPEVPLGTIAILVSMFGALGIYAIKKRFVQPRTPT
jgi:hypothetical protein